MVFAFGLFLKMEIVSKLMRSIGKRKQNILPLPNGPKSPPRLAELQSEYLPANSSSVACPDEIYFF